MKKIEAIIRPEQLDSVRSALEKLGYPGMAVSEVKGYGKQGGQKKQWRGREYETSYVFKLKIDIVVIDEDLPRMVNALVKSARTGDTGDGKVFVLPVDGAVRIRTGDDGDNAI